MKPQDVSIIGYCPATLGGLMVKFRLDIEGQETWFKVCGISPDVTKTMEEFFFYVCEGEDEEWDYEKDWELELNDKRKAKRYRRILTTILLQGKFFFIARHYDGRRKANDKMFYDFMGQEAKDLGIDEYRAMMGTLKAEEEEIKLATGWEELVKLYF